MSRLAVIMACLALGLSGCSSKDDQVNWSRQPLLEVRESADGINFSITVPRGLMPTRADRAVTWMAPGQSAERDHKAPQIRVAVENTPAPVKVDQAVSRALAASNARVVLRQERIAGGHLVVHHSEDRRAIAATVYRALSEPGRRRNTRPVNTAPGRRTLSCTASIERAKSPASSETVSQLQITASWLANICLTLASDQLTRRR